MLGEAVSAARSRDSKNLKLPGIYVRGYYEHATHVEGVAQDERNTLGGAEVGQPVPGEHALGGHHQVVAVRGDDPQEVLWLTATVLVDQNIAGLIDVAE